MIEILIETASRIATQQKIGNHGKEIIRQLPTQHAFLSFGKR